MFVFTSVARYRCFVFNRALREAMECKVILVYTHGHKLKERATQLLRREGGAHVTKCAEAVGIARIRWNWVNIDHSYWFADAQ